MTLKHLQHEAHKIRMTPAEKSAMRAAIFGTPSPVTTSTASPYFFFDFQFMTRALAAVLLVVLIGGGGVAYAAEGSLPGQPLYAVKVNVTEPIKTALATSPAARAAVHVELAQRRVEEAEALASQGTLDATTTQELEQNFEEHAQSADELATEVGATDPSAAVEIKAELASSLGVHGALLATIASENKSGGTNKQNSEQLASRVIARADAAADISSDSAPSASAATKVVAMATPTAPRPQAKAMATFAARTTSVETEATATESGSGAATNTTVAANSSTSASSTTESQTNANSSSNDNNNTANKDNGELKSRAQDALEKAKSVYDDAKSKLDADAAASLNSQFATIQSNMDAGNYTAALTLALRLQVIIKAQANYRTNIITPLLQLQFNQNENRHDSWNRGDSNDDH